jgi:hypothetical protein
MHGPVPLSTFCRLWNRPLNASGIDLFFIDTEGSDDLESDGLSIKVLPALSAVISIRIGVLSKRPNKREQGDLILGLRNTLFLSDTPPSAVVVVVRECAPPGFEPVNQDKHESRLAHDRNFRERFIAHMEEYGLARFFQPDGSRFLGLCQSCCMQHEVEYRSSMTDLAQFIALQASAAQIMSVE